MKKIVLTLSLALPTFMITVAQQAQPCGMGQATEKMMLQHPGLKELAEQVDAEEITQADGSVRAVKVIPVVVHIIHNYGNENISDAQVHDAIRILNEDFQLRQPDTANIAAAFKGIQGDPDFEFRLARKDPDGNCTSGITRTVSTLTYEANDNVKDNIWPRDKYMNVWVVNRVVVSGSTVGGYTYRPSFALPGVDGIIVTCVQFGSIGTSSGGALARRTLSHETGHWFNLKHTWGDSNSPGVSCGTDDVSDTPQTVGVAAQNCVTTTQSCGSLDNIQNIMDYSSCPIMFTQGQASRIIAAANSSTASRNNLWSASNLTATGVADGFADTLCAPVADFNVTQKVICVGSSLSFTDLSYNAGVTSWAWTFTNTSDGVTVLTSSDQNPSMTFTVPGLYTVSLVATNSQGNNTVVKNEYVRVYPDGAQFASNGYTESFENNFEADGWFAVNDNETIGWQVTSSASVTGSNSMMVQNFLGEGTESYNLYSPSYDLSAIGSPKLRFKYAYAERTTDDDDRLRVYLSVNCGASWIQMSPPISHAALITAPTATGFFVPTSSQWAEKEFTISATFASSTNIRFRFEFDASGGNNVYLEDINIAGNASVEEAIVNSTSWEVFPNPADEFIDVRFNIDNISSVNDQLLICDASGRVQKRMQINGGATMVHIDISDLSAGVYFIRTEKGTMAGTKKIIVR